MARRESYDDRDMPSRYEMPELDVKKFYVIVGTGKNSNMPEGKEYVQPGGMAKILIESGAATYKCENHKTQ
jgi:hypothetical protein